MRTKIQRTVDEFNKDQNRLVDILSKVQDELGFISKEAIEIIAEQLNLSGVDVEQTRSFYHFLTDKPAGKYVIYLNDSVVANMMGRADVAKAMEEEAGCKFGEISEDGIIGLHNTACIGMSDQEPAAIINGKVFTNLTPVKVKELIQGMKVGKAVEDMITEYGDGVNAQIKSMVKNNIMNEGKVLFAPYEIGTAITKSKLMQPSEVISEVKASNIKGRGGAGFPTGMKWEFTANAEGLEKYVICNADEGEPGTFKDRVILTEYAERVFEGMAVCGHAIGAKEGILYLRGEYDYLTSYLNNVIETIKPNLGNFNIRIQLGQGAYICGEETALIESMEGKRGEPRNKPPFPAQKGYMDKPTTVNNVETFASVVKIMEKGAAWYNEIGTKESSGTKLLSISGDCDKPGVYEVEWGMTIKEMIEMVGANDVQAVQVAGPSGVCLNPSQFERKIAFEDLATGGSMIIIGNQRNLLKDVVLNFMNFFADESCGSCAPCRNLNAIMRNKLAKITEGKGIKSDIDDLLEWGKVMTATTRCGLGQTSANPIISTITNFRDKYEAIVQDIDYISNFDLAASVQASCDAVGRKPILH